MQNSLINKKISLVVGLLIVSALFLLPLTGISDHYIKLLTLAAIVALAVVSLDVLMGYVGLLSLGQAGFMAIGAYTSAILTVVHGFNPFVALLIAQVITVVLSIFIGKAVIRLKGYHLAVATMAFSVIVEQLLVNLRDLTGGPSGLAGVPSFSIGSLTIKGGLPLYYFCIAIVVIVLILLKNLMNGRVGRAWHATAGDDLAASCLGVNTNRYKLLAFGISSSVAALSGTLYVHYMHFISPEMVGMQTSFNLVVMMSLGGAGTLVGPILGATILTFLPDVITIFKDYELIINGLVLLLTMVFFPGGLLSLLTLPYHAYINRKKKNEMKMIKVMTVLKDGGAKK